MAERVLINKQILQDSIDAIRAKKGTTDSIVVADMPTEIASIEGGGSGIADSTKTLVNAISGVTPTDETTLNNAIASAYADTPTEQKWNGTRSTAEGGTIKDGVAFLQSVKGSTMKYNQKLKPNDNLETKVVNGITWTLNANGTITANGTATADSDYTFGYAYLKNLEGHKIALFGVNDGSASTYRMFFTYVGAIYNEYILTCPNYKANLSVSFRIYNGYTASNLTFRPMAFDLTEMGVESLASISAVAQYFGYASSSVMPVMPYEPTTNLRNFTHNTITSKDEDNATLDTLSLNVPSSVFPNGMRSNGETFDEWIPGEGEAVKRIGDDGEVLDTPLTYNLTKVKAFFKVANGGTETISGGENSAPIKADIGYKEATATELINALNG